MSCCRRSVPRRPTNVAICKFCRRSLRNQIREAITKASVLRTLPGTYRDTVTVQCSCTGENAVPIIYVKR